MATKGQPIKELEQMIISDIEATVKETEKKINPLTLTVPNLANWRTPLVIEHNGKTTIHGERNPHLAFENATKKN